MLTRLPGSKWWIETSDNTFEIIGTYNKAQITADIQAIKDTLLKYPDPSKDAKDVGLALNAISNAGWAAEKASRVSALVNAMYQAYQGDPLQVEAAQLQARLDALIALRERLV